MKKEKEKEDDDDDEDDDEEEEEEEEEDFRITSFLNLVDHKEWPFCRAVFERILNKGGWYATNPERLLGAVMAETSGQNIRRDGKGQGKSKQESMFLRSFREAVVKEKGKKTFPFFLTYR